MKRQIIYHLVLEARPGDFMPIDINVLLNNQEPNNYNLLHTIDEFTKRYTEDEIKELIKANNLVSDLYINGKLQIINENKYRYMVITRDIDFSFDVFFAEHINDKLIMNKFLNIYLKYCKETKDSMREALNEKNVYHILEILFNNEYEKVRNIYSYIYEKVILKTVK